MKKMILTVFIVSISLVCGYIQAIASESVLPPVETDKSRLSSAGKVYVRQFRLEGNTVFSDEALAPLLKPYEGREITAEEMHDAKEQITRYYVANGYVNSGAVIPDQKVEGGMITLQIIEGRLTQTTVTGNKSLRNGYIRKRAQLAVGSAMEEPLNTHVLQDRLKMLKQNPRIENISATLSPGVALGESRLEIEIHEARPYHLNFVFNNHNTPSIGAYRGEVNFSHLNLTGWGDTLTAQYALTEGLDEYSADYTLPITKWDTTLAFRFDRSESVVVADPFHQLDIKSDTDTYGVELRHPFYKTLTTEFAMGFQFERRKTETSLLGVPYSFEGSGASQGETEFNMYRFSQEWVKRSVSQVVAAYSGINIGDVLTGEEEGGFFSWIGQFQWLRHIGFLDSQILFRLNMQLSGDTLVAAEKVAIGGSDTVRGYRENQMTTDSGIISSLEWRIPLIQVKMPVLSKKNTDGYIRLIPFADAGKGWNSDLADPDPDTIYSLGLGVRWDVSEDTYAEIYWGKSLKDTEPYDEYDLQDDGIHFQVVAGVF